MAEAGSADHPIHIEAEVDGVSPETKIVLFQYDSFPAIGAYTTGAITSKVSNVSNPYSGFGGTVDANATGAIGKYDGTNYGFEINATAANNTFTNDNNRADVAPIKVDSPERALLGQVLTYTLTVSHKGLSTGEEVILVDNLPEAVSLVSLSAAQGTCTGSSTVTCNLGTLSSGDSVNVTIVVVPNSTGDLTNVANVTHGVDDPDTGDNTVTQTAMVVAAANLAVTKSDSTDPALIEEPLTHSVTVTNNGPSSAIGMGSLIPCRSKSPSNPRQRPTARVLKPQES